MAKAASLVVLAWALLLGLVVVLWVMVATAHAQQQPNAVSTYPIPGSTLNGGASTTITATGTYQQLWPSNQSRHSCLIQNAGTHNMTVTEGVSTTASLTTNAGPFIIQPNGAFTCNFGQTVLSGQINIGGTAGDQFYAAQF